MPGQVGAGYVILDPTTGSAAWKISGGQSGSFYDFCQNEGSERLFCSAYVWVYDCVNPADGDLSCTLGYGVATAGAATFLGVVGAALASIAAALELFAALESLWYSDLPAAVIFGATLFAVWGVLMAAFSSAGFVSGLVVALIAMFLIAALTSLVRDVFPIEEQTAE